MHLIMDASTKGIRSNVLEHLNTLAEYTGADIFLLSPKMVDADSAVVSSYVADNGLDNRFRVAIYGDMESAEHAKTRLLIMIDQIVSDRLCAPSRAVQGKLTTLCLVETPRRCHEAGIDDAHLGLRPNT
jgi:hypothetical protein